MCGVTGEVDVGLQSGQAGVAQRPKLVDPQPASTAREQLPQRDPLGREHNIHLLYTRTVPFPRRGSAPLTLAVCNGEWAPNKLQKVKKSKPELTLKNVS